jgi:pyruvate dehydrogenase E2 component (dihydrolipoamide acetyltransferase)
MIDVVMPQMGESIVEGTLTRWLKKAGEHVERDEPLFEISTDKVDTEIPSPSAGTLGEILVQEGTTVGINTVVGRIAEADGTPVNTAAAPAATPSATAAPVPPAQPPAAAPVNAVPAPQVNSVPAPDTLRPQAAPQADGSDETSGGPLSPLVRKMARENNVDLNQVRGSGAGGRITKQDVDAFISARGGAQRQTPPSYAPPAPAYSAPAYSAPAPAQTYTPPPPPAPAQTYTAPPPPPAQEIATVRQPVNVPPAQPPAPYEAPAQFRGQAPAGRVEPMSTMRQKIAEHMVFSKRTSAHVTTVHKVDMTRVSKLRDKAKGEFQNRYGFSLTFLPFVLRATTAALQQFPLLNASIDGTNIVYHRDINLGIAVALENGLIVPVIRNADEKNVVGLQRSIADLATRARSRQLRPDEVQAGTFSVTNFGSFGSVFATPVINQPQVGILGVGAVTKEPVVVDDAIAIRSMCYLALTFDHRLIDGALGDQFTQKVKNVLENWSEEVL